jgi:hypothetical protein
VVGTLIFVLVLMLAMGAQAYMSGLQAEAAEVYGQAQQVLGQHGEESLAYGFSASGLVVANGGPATSEVVGMYIRDPNGSVYSGSTFPVAYLPAGSEASVKSLVPAGVCLPTGTTSCLARFLDATRGSGPGYSVGLTTSLGNTFWYPSTEDAPGNLSVYYDALGATYFDYNLASVGCGVALPIIPVVSVRVDASVGVLGTGSFQTNVYVYRSTVGIPPTGSPPGGADTRVAQCSLSGSASGVICSLDFVDGGLKAGATYYFYLAASTTGSFASEILGGTPVQTSVTVELL